MPDEASVKIAITIYGVTRYMSEKEATNVHNALAKALAYPIKSGRESYSNKGVKIQTVIKE